MDKFELIFEPFSSILNSLTQEEDLREFLLNEKIRLETRVKRFIIHENHNIRLATHQTMRHLLFSYELEPFAKRFCKIDPQEAHVIFLLLSYLSYVLEVCTCL